mgnify:CR=1 FL=1
MEKIIVPIDFSEHSEFALKTAAGLAIKYNAEVLALHMLELSNALISETDNSKQAEAVFYLKLAEQKFTDFLDKPFLKDVNVTPIVKHFKVFKEDVNEVTQTNLVKLNHDERIVEIAQMLGGIEMSSSAIAHAKELLN